MKVFLVNAASKERDLDHSTPVGVMALAAFLRDRNGCEVGLSDMQLHGRSLDPVLSAVRTFRPDLIGISGMTIDAGATAALSRECKRELPAVPVVVGGAQATHSPEAVLENPSVDLVIRGEGEIGLAALVGALQEGRPWEAVPNLSWREDGTVRHNPQAPYIEDLDSLPSAAHDLIDLEAYFRLPHPCFIFARERYAVVMTSRGCPFGCSYCHIVHGRTYRYRSAENFVQEMRQLVEEYGVGEFAILDDLFNLIPGRVERIAEGILESGLDVKLNIPTGLRGELMTEEGMRLLKKAGMYRCLFAVDSVAPRIRKMTGRTSDVQKTLHMIELAHELDILVHGTFMIGFPTETEAEARQTIETAMSAKLHTVAFHRAIPFPGTELHRIAVSAGADLSGGPEHFDFNKDSALVNASAMRNETLSRLRKRAYRRFYLSPKRMWNLFRLLPNKRVMLPMLFRVWIQKAFTG